MKVLLVSMHADGYSKEDLESKLHPLGFKTHQSKYTYGFGVIKPGGLVLNIR
jgi:hypothetical protein